MLREGKFINDAKRAVDGFTELLYRFERTISVLGRSRKTFECYSRHVAAIALYYGKLSTELDAEQVHDYLFYLQKKSKTPLQTYFKHTFYGLRFLYKTGTHAPLPALIVGVRQLNGGKWALVKLLFPVKSDFTSKGTYVQW